MYFRAKTTMNYTDYGRSAGHPQSVTRRGVQLRTPKLSLADAGGGPLVTISLLLRFLLECGFPNGLFQMVKREILKYNNLSPQELTERTKHSSRTEKGRSIFIESMRTAGFKLPNIICCTYYQFVIQSVYI